MGQLLSLSSRRAFGGAGTPPPVCDFELVIRASKELEWILEAHFGASGRGLHERVASVEASGELPSRLSRRMHFIATIRNKLIHERGFDAIPDRPRFISEFAAARQELDGLLAYREAKLRAGRGEQPQGRDGGSGGGCVVM